MSTSQREEYIRMKERLRYEDIIEDKLNADAIIDREDDILRKHKKFLRIKSNNEKLELAGNILAVPFLITGGLVYFTGRGIYKGAKKIASFTKNLNKESTIPEKPIDIDMEHLKVPKKRFDDCIETLAKIDTGLIDGSMSKEEAAKLISKCTEYIITPAMSSECSP